MIIPTLDWRTQSLSTDNLPQVHDLHPTGLEAFMSCPYKFHYELQNKDTDISEAGREAFYE